MKIRSCRKEKPSLGITLHLDGLASSSEVLNTQEIWRLHRNASTRNTYLWHCKAQIEMQMQDQEKSVDCSRHCRPGNQLTTQNIGRLFPLAKTYTNTNILIHIEKNKHKHSSTLCCSLFLRGVRQRAGPYVRRGFPLRWSQYCETFFDVDGRGPALSSCPTPSSISSGRAVSTTWKCPTFEHFSAHFNHLHFSWRSSRWRFGSAWIKSLRWQQESLRYLFHCVCVPKKLKMHG